MGTAVQIQNIRELFL